MKNIFFNALILCTVVFNCNSNLHAQIINTVAGNNTSAYSGDHGAATIAAIGQPWCVVADDSGNFYIADASNNVVRKVSAAGIITTVAGDGTPGYSGDIGPAVSAKLNAPQGIALDTLGNLYIADDGNFVVRKVTPGGNIYTFAGNGTTGYSGDGLMATSAQLPGVIGVVADKKGNVYISDGNDAIRKVDASGIISTYAGSEAYYGYFGDGGAATSAALASPAGIAIDDTGNLFIADNQNNVIRKVDTFGIITTVAGNGYLAEAGGFPPTGGYTGDGGPADSAELNEPYGVAVDNYGNFFIADQANNAIRKVNANAVISTIAGNGYDASVGYGSYSGDGGLATLATLNYPVSVATDAAGSLFIADMYNYVIRKVNGLYIASGSGDTVCAGSSVIFSATATNAGSSVSYQWKINGIIQPIHNPVFLVDSVNNGDVITCKVCNSISGAVIDSSNAITMTVASIVTPSVTISSSPGSVCPGSPVLFTASVVNGGASPSYQWEVNDSLITTSADSLTYTSLLSSGSYTAKCIVTSSAACLTGPVTTSNILTISLSPTVVPSVTISGSASICSGSLAMLAATPINGGASPFYQWSVNGVNTATGNTYTYLPSTGDVVRCVLTSSACALPDTAADSVTIELNPHVSPLLTITASADTVCSGTTVSYTTTAVHPGSSPVYTWQVNGTIVSGGSSYSYVPANGDHVSCTMVSDASCAAPATVISDTIVMHVNAPAIPSVSIMAEEGDTVCAGTTEYYIANPVNGGASPSYTWYRDGINVAIGDTFTYVPVNGDVIKCVMVGSSACVVSDTAVVSPSVTMVVNPIVSPAVSIATPVGDTVCVGTVVTYTAIAVHGGTTPLYQWKVNGINVSTGVTYTYTPVAGDVISVVLTGNPACAIVDTAEANIAMTVDPILTPSGTITSGSGDTVCAGTVVTYFAIATNGGASPAFQWRKNGVNVATGSTYTCTPVGGDIITCVITSDYPCLTTTGATSNAISMTISSLVIPSVSVVAMPGGIVCAGTSVTYSATTTGGGTLPGFQWKKNGSDAGTGNSYTYIPESGDLITCELTSNAACAAPDTAVSVAITMTVTADVTPSLNISASPGTTVTSEGEPITFSAVPTGGGATPAYQWLINGIAIPGATGSTFVVDTFQTNDTVACALVSDAPCATPASVVSNELDILVSLGVSQLSAAPFGIVLLPNPNTGSFTIKSNLGLSADIRASLQVTDMLGQIVYDNIAMLQQGRLDMDINLNRSLPNGTYLLHVRSGDVNATLHFVIEK